MVLAFVTQASEPHRKVGFLDVSWSGDARDELMLVMRSEGDAGSRAELRIGLEEFRHVVRELYRVYGGASSDAKNP